MQQKEMVLSSGAAGRLLTSYKDDEEDEDDMEELRRKILKTSGIVLREKKELADRKIRRLKPLTAEQQSEIDRRVVSASSRELSSEKHLQSPGIDSAVRLLPPPAESSRQLQYHNILQQVHSPGAFPTPTALATQDIAKVLPIAASVLLSSKQKLAFTAWLEAYRRRFSESSLDFGAETINRIVKAIPLSVEDLVAVAGMKEEDGSIYGEHAVATIYAFLENKDLLHLFPHAQPPLIADSMDWKNPIEYWKLQDSKDQPNLEVIAFSAEREQVDTDAKSIHSDEDSVVFTRKPNSSWKSRPVAVDLPRDSSNGGTTSNHISSNKRKYKKLSKNSSGGGGGGSSEGELDSESGYCSDSVLIEGTILLSYR